MPLVGHRLSAKLTRIALLFLLVALAGIGFTLYESWQVEGGAAAINDMGSERMRSYHIAYLLAETVRDPSTNLRDEILGEMRRIEEVLDTLEKGDPARPLVLPRDPKIQGQLVAVRGQWNLDLRPRILQILDAQPGEPRSQAMTRVRTDIERFVTHVDSVVLSVEQNNAYHIAFLRSIQTGLLALAIVGTVALIYLMFLLVVRPVERLSEGMQRMARGQFDVRLPIETRDEFGELAAGFNRMAIHLEDLYRTLEERVASKTQDLEEKNRELGALYGMATLLNERHSLEDLCRDFILRLMELLKADAGSVRLVDAREGKIHLYLHEGLPEDFVREESCIDIGRCLCGEAAQRDASMIEYLPAAAQGNAVYGCQKAGFRTIAVFNIRFHGEILGIYNLYFREQRTLGRADRNMLEALGQQLGVAIQNQRLVARMKQVAVSEERNLLAQELHDSIAQSLAFLNIEAQMLEGALKKQNMREAEEILAQIRSGIAESYENVRELLVHFRTRIKQEDIALTLRNTLEMFQQQTGITARFVEEGAGIALPLDRQLQALHILQEALSNVRKHAAASEVDVRMSRGESYEFTVTDNGRGFDLDDVAGRQERHIGLRIMRERAHSIGADIEIASRPGHGTTVKLSLPAVAPAQAAGDPVLSTAKGSA